MLIIIYYNCVKKNCDCRLLDKTMATSEMTLYPDTELTSPYDEQIIVGLMQFLNERIKRRDLLRENLHQKQSNFRNILVELERENVSLKEENLSLKTCNAQQRKMISLLEARISKLDNQIDSLLYKLNSANDVMKNMQQEIRNKDRQIKQHVIDKQKIIQKCSHKIQTETDKLAKELEIKLYEQREQLESCIRKKSDKLKLMKEILISDRENMIDSTILMNLDAKTRNAEESMPMLSEKSSVMTSINEMPAEMPTSTVITADTAITSISKSDVEVKNTDDPNNIESCRLSREDKIPVVNPRYRHSQSADVWIDHRPARIVPVGTILQPQTPYRRSVTKLTNPKAFTDKSARYCLLAQEQDTDGELETKLYKADILPTSGGGAQIVFNDVECLKQVSPIKIKHVGR